MKTETYVKLMNYIDHNPLAVIGTVSDDQTPYGAVVYACTLSNSTVCFVTKNGTQTYQNLSKQPVASLTVGNAQQGSTLQARGRTFVIDDPMLVEAAIQKMADIHAQVGEWLPPLAKLKAGDYVVIGIELLWARLSEFGPGSQKTVTEI